MVIVYDVRRFADLNGTYNRELPNPLLGLESQDFCRIAAEVYAAMGFRTFVPEQGSDFVSTPELSFTIRQLGTSAGLNISASHNPPDDNGGKFYNEFGAQHVPPSDETMARRVASVRFLARLNFESAEEAGLVERIPSDIHEQYVDMNVAQSLRPEHRSSHVVFTPLHGTGTTTVGAAAPTSASTRV